MSQLTKTPQQVEAWLLALEAERLDISYRRLRKAESVVELVKAERAKKRAPAKDVPDDVEQNLKRLQREQLIFDYGRYVGGARDERAAKAFKLLHQQKGK